MSSSVSELTVKADSMAFCLHGIPRCSDTTDTSGVPFWELFF